MYVAITRAKEKLWLTRSQTRYLYGRREPTMRSRFVGELEPLLGIKEPRARYTGDFGDGYESRFRARDHGFYGGRGYGTSAPRRVGTASEYGRTDYGSPSAEEGHVFGGTQKSSRPQSEERVQAKKSTSGVELSRFQVGTRVRHTRFGEGVVTAMRGSGSNLIVTVKFEVAGYKDLAAVLAPLEILS